jgi:hypothetical protein
MYNVCNPDFNFPTKYAATKGLDIPVCPLNQNKLFNEW